MFKIEVTEIHKISESDPGEQIKRFEQTVDELNLRALITAVNTPKRGPRATKPKEGAK